MPASAWPRAALSPLAVLYAARQTLIQLRQEQSAASINLFRALGGPIAQPTQS